MLRIWGRTSSLNVRKVVWAANECGVPYERIDAGRQFGIVDDDAYRRMNPNGLVPVIEDDGFTLWESNVIVRYLCATHSAGKLCPEAPRARFDAERWMDWQQTTLNPAGRGAFVQWIRTPEAERDPGAIARSLAATEPLWAMLDAELARRPFVAGEAFTMADIPIGCELHRWRALPHVDRPPARPHLDAWYARVLARPATRGVLDLELS